MKRTAQVVIGSCFGDEGKGLMTDYLAGDADLVVRFNGGAQAGHTVVTPEGLRHIFSHFGSGTLRGVPTYLSDFFVANPILFNQEMDEIAKLGTVPDVSASRFMRVTTPYDMMLNRFVEEARGDSRHGSVGVGFGETIERCQHPYFSTIMTDLVGRPAVPIQRILDDIRKEWVPYRARQLGLTLTNDQLAIINDDTVLDTYLKDLVRFVDRIDLTLPHIAMRKGNIVFEGAQGLMLDQFNGYFPYVTRSNTGLANVIALAKLVNIDALNVHYMTRCYLTRHGAGPLKGEMPANTAFPSILDQTNVPNDWQGTMRFAPHDAEEVGKFILQDLATDSSGIEITPQITMTCCDQLMDGVALQKLHALQAVTNIWYGHTSWGPTRATMIDIGRRIAA